MNRLVLYPLFAALPFLSVAKNETAIGNAANVTPLVFIENKGQISNDKIDFKLAKAGVTVFIENGKLHYQWSKTQGIPGSDAEEGKGQYEAYRMDVVLLGANARAQKIAENTAAYYEKHYNASGIITAHSYSKVIYKDVYPHIDWVLYTKEGGSGFEYDFVVHPGGDVKDIRIQYNGAVSLGIKDGMLEVKTPFGNLSEQKPYSYIASNKSVTGTIASSFRLNNNVLSFDVAKYKGTLVIDPVVTWGSYFGGAQAELFYSICADAAGNTYVAGYTSSNADIATAGAFKTSHSGGQDAILVKFSAAGQRIWATYYGGSSNDYFRSVVCDAAGNIYAAGQTNSNTGIHSSGAHDTSYNGGGNDVFLVKFDSAGNRKWGTYYGGTGNETIGYMACDKNCNVYIAGATASASGIASAGTVHKASYNGPGTNGFLTRFDSSGAQQWGTYYGNGNTAFVALSCDADGNVYAGGTTNSATDIHTAKAHDTALGQANINDGFVVKFNAAGARQWGTYFGGKGTDDVKSITTPKDGYIYIAGTTRSDSSVATAGSFKDTIANLLNTDAYIAKLSTDSGKVRWSTYYGGSFNDNINSIAISGKDKIFVTGNTINTTGIATTGSIKDTYSGSGDDAFLVIFDTAGYRHYGTYYGGNLADAGWCVMSQGTHIYIAGQTQSLTDIATVNSFQDTLTGGIDGFIVKLQEDLVSIARPISADTLCPGDTIMLKFTTAQNFNAGNIFTAELSDTAGSFLIPVSIGSLGSITDGTIVCKLPYDLYGGTQYRLRFKASNPAYISTDRITDIVIKQGPHKPEIINNSPFCEGWNLSLYSNGALPGSSYLWSGPDNFYTTLQSVNFSTTKQSDSGDYYVTVTLNGCSARDTAEVKIYSKSTVVKATSNSPICDGGDMTLSATSNNIPGVKYEWAGPNGFIDTGKAPSRQGITLAASGLYTVTADLFGCGADTTTVVITEIPKVTASSNSPLDSGETLELKAEGSQPDFIYKWSGPDSFESDFQNPTIDKAKSVHSGAYVVKASKNGCDGFDTTIVVVNSIATSSLSIAPNPTTGNLTLKGTVLSEQVIPLVILNSYGQSVYSDNISTSNLGFAVTLKLTSLPNGTYRMKLKIDNEIILHEFVMIQQ